jgi:glutamate formiminotransferase
LPEPLFEIVPNISEGRDRTIVDACADAVNGAGARVIDRTSDDVHNRSVITAVGTRNAVLDAGVALAGCVAARIDLRTHAGVHPRIGALDVLPFVPLHGATLDDATHLAHDAARRIWETHRIPSYYYDAASDRRRTLPEVRQGGFEPDVGDGAHASAGAIAIGARQFLVAFNIELATGDVGIARSIARVLREKNGGLRTLRALGLPREAGVVQVSFNITDVSAIPIYRVVELVRRLAAEHGVKVVRSELIGLAPRDVLCETAAYYVGSAAPRGKPQTL